MSWLSDLDPTNPSNFSFDLGGTIPVVGPIIAAYGQRRAADAQRERAEQDARDREAFYNRLGGEYRDVPTSPTTQARAQTLGDLRTREVDRGLAEGERSIAGSYSRRGIGGSGYAASAQSAAIAAASAERSRQRASALDQAVAEGQRGILGQAQVSHMGDPFIDSMLRTSEDRYNTALAQSARERDEYQQLIMRLIGMAAGGFGGGGMPMGAGAGSVAGGGVTGGGMYPGVQAPTYIS